jgi:hypothetical protein
MRWNLRGLRSLPEESLISGLPYDAANSHCPRASALRVVESYIMSRGPRPPFNGKIRKVFR